MADCALQCQWMNGITINYEEKAQLNKNSLKNRVRDRVSDSDPVTRWHGDPVPMMLPTSVNVVSPSPGTSRFPRFLEISLKDHYLRICANISLWLFCQTYSCRLKWKWSDNNDNDDGDDDDDDDELNHKIIRSLYECPIILVSWAQLFFIYIHSFLYTFFLFCSGHIINNDMLYYVFQQSFCW